MKYISILLIFLTTLSHSQSRNSDTENKSKDPIVQSIVDEANNNSQLEVLAHELFDVIGPRLVGTPQMKQAHDWAVKKYNEWGIEAYNHEWGKWRGWERGITHIDMIEPRLRTLVGRQLAWSPSTKKKGIKGEAVIVPEIDSKDDFERWLKTVKGKFVLTSQYQLTGRSDSNWKEFALPETFEKMKDQRREISRKWYSTISSTGYGYRDISKAYEKAGAIGLISSYWSRVSGSNKVFYTQTQKIPEIDVNLEDYGMLYRLAKNGRKPVIKLIATSNELGDVPTFNTIAQIKGVEKPNEYVILSAHFDSWDGGQGTTDNGTGTLVMLEAMRILKKIYPNPKRTILVGHWGSEEQGLNGSRAFVEDFPEIIKNTQSLFNQDNGTGRVVNLSGQGFLYSYEFLSRWLSFVPKYITDHIETEFPGEPSYGSTDHASFIAAGVPAFNLDAISWDYRNLTWHTNLDTYDKIVFDDVKRNVITTAILAYKASEEEELVSREKRVMPISPRTGRKMDWPSVRKPNRDGTSPR
jgi:hypothetical protein